jgi:hypothetical protein
MFGSALPREHLVTDQAEAQVFIENAEDLADIVCAGEHCSLDVVKHARLRGFFKHVLPEQS